MGDDHFSDPSVTCAGIRSISGTGPFKFVSRTTNTDGLDDLFARNDKYWDGVPDVEILNVVRYDNADAVKQALLDGTLDLVIGAGVLDPNDVEEEFLLYRNDQCEVLHSDPVANAIVVLNAARHPTDDTRRNLVVPSSSSLLLLFCCWLAYNCVVYSYFFVASD